MVRRMVWLAVLALGALAACTLAEATPSAPRLAPSKEVPMSSALTLSSPAFAYGETIPRRYTCDGEDLSPPLAWQNAPEGTQAWALIMDDPDAPMGTWVHWVLYDLPAETTTLPEGVRQAGIAGRNSWDRLGYGGPCPPPGKPHRYFFRLYALDAPLGLPPGATKAQVARAMQGHILAQAEWMGRYGR